MEASAKGHVEVVRILVEEGKANVDQGRTTDYDTAMMVASFNCLRWCASGRCVPVI